MALKTDVWGAERTAASLRPSQAYIIPIHRAQLRSSPSASLREKYLGWLNAYGCTFMSPDTSHPKAVYRTHDVLLDGDHRKPQVLRSLTAPRSQCAAWSESHAR